MTGDPTLSVIIDAIERTERRIMEELAETRREVRAVRTAADESGKLIRAIWAELGSPEEEEGENVGDPDGSQPRRPGRRRWGIGEELDDVARDVFGIGMGLGGVAGEAGEGLDGGHHSRDG